jgi:membrane-associated phospholipid phosphatase
MAAAAADPDSAFNEAMLALTLSAVLCYLVFVVWPVQGPRYLAAPPGIPDGPIRSLTLSLVETGSSRGAAFPSSHVAISVAQTLSMLRHRRGFGVVLALVTFLLAMGAVYAGFHYVIDTLAGLAFGTFAVWLARPLARGARAPLPGFARPAE